MDIRKTIKSAMVLTVVFYPVVAFAVCGVPKWNAAFIPDQKQVFLFYILVPASVVLLLLGTFLGRLPEPPLAMKSSQATDSRSWILIRMILALSILEGAAIMGLVLSIVLHDSRYSLIASIVTVPLMLIVPASED